jgi:hypothetical protein
MIQRPATYESANSGLLSLGEIPIVSLFALTRGTFQETADELARLDPADCDAGLRRVRGNALIRLQRSCRSLLVDVETRAVSPIRDVRFAVPSTGIAFNCEICGSADRIRSAKRTWALPITWRPNKGQKLSDWRSDGLVPGRIFVQPGGRSVRYVLVCADCSRSARRGKRGIQRCRYIESYGACCDQLASRGADYCAAHRRSAPPA